MIKTLIVDDEESAIKTIEAVLRDYCPNVDVIANTTSPVEAIKIIEEKKPHLVFLDIDMPEMDGFEMLENIQIKNFEVIFITAINHHALKAFKVSAVDYILKPINIPELIKAVSRVEKLVKAENFNNDKYNILLENIKSVLPKKIALPSADGAVLVLPDEIICIESSKNYSTFHLLDGREALISKTIGDVEALLQYEYFIRIHKMTIINLKHIIKYNIRRTGGEVIMRNAKKLFISRRKKKLFIDKFENHIKKL